LFWEIKLLKRKDVLRIRKKLSKRQFFLPKEVNTKMKVEKNKVKLVGR